MQCSSVALTWFALGASKLMHKPRNEAIHRLKAALQFVGAGAALAPLCLGLGDAHTSRWIAGVNVGVVLVMNLVTLAATSKAAEDRLGSEFSQSMRPRADSLARVMR